MSLWTQRPPQSTSSAATSVAQVPALLRRAPIPRGALNVDIGGGRYDAGTRALARRGVTSIVYDPFNRTPMSNLHAAQRACCGSADTATIANVLNVIPSAPARRRVLTQAADAVGDRGTVFIAVYEGAKDGRGRTTSKGWQANRRRDSYLAEIRQVFRDVEIVDGIITARRPRKLSCACPLRR